MTNSSEARFATTFHAAPGELSRRAVDLIRYWLAFIACFGLLIFRGWDRITHPELFSEGIKFIGSILNEGWRSLLEVQDQALHMAPKVIALLAVNVAPVADIPMFTNLACFAATAAVMATIVRPGYRWIIPSDGARVALALLLTLAPGLIEILGNLAGLHWSLLLWMGLLALKDPKHPLTVWEILLAVVTLATSAGAVVFLPLAFLRLLLARGRHAAAPYYPAVALPRVTGEALLFSSMLLIAAFLTFNFFGVEGSTPGSTGFESGWRGLDDLLPSLGALFTTFYVLHPFLGTENTSLFLLASPFYPLLTASLLLVTILLCRLGREMDYRFWLIPTWIICLLLLGVMLSIARYWAFYGMFSYPYWDWWARYNFVFACSGLVFWFALLRPRILYRLTHWSTILTVVLTVSYVSQAGTVTTHASPGHREDGYAVERYGEKRYWSKTSDELASSMKTGCPPKVEVRGYPGGKWRFVYESPLAPAECPTDTSKNKTGDK